MHFLNAKINTCRELEIVFIRDKTIACIILTILLITKWLSRQMFPYGLRMSM